VLWGDVPLEVRAFPSRRGEVRAEAGTPAAWALRQPGFRLARLSAGEAALDAPPGAEGELTTPAGVHAIAPDPEEPVTLPPDGSLTWRLGGIRLRLRWVHRTRGLHTPLLERLDTTFLNLLLLVVFSAAALVATFHLRPLTRAPAEVELHRVPPRAVEFLVHHARPAPPPILERIAPDQAAAAGPRARGPEGEAGTPDRVRRPQRLSIRGNHRPEEARLGGQGFPFLGVGAAPGLGDLIGRPSLGHDLENAIGDLRSTVPGPSGGEGGLGLRGPGHGGGGRDDLIQIGRLPTGGPYAVGLPARPGRSRRPVEGPIRIHVGDLRVHGPLSMDAIRAVVHSHHDQVRYCYNQALLGQPALSGKLLMHFAIDERGYVSEATTRGNGTGDASLAACVRAKVLTWRFPMPRGGGEVRVTYPFVFHRPR